MINNDPTSSYQQASVCGASPIGQVVALYDTILRDFGRALAAVRAGDIETRVFELNHAIVVIGYLQSTVDHERGGDPAQHFERFYSVTRGLVVEANFKAKTEPIEKLIELYSGVRQAWYQVEQQAHTGQTQASQKQETGTDRTGNSAEDDTNPAKKGLDIPQLQWSA
jgi:flagellar protein FliS